MKTDTSVRRMLFSVGLILMLIITVSGQNRSGTYRRYNKWVRNNITFQEVKQGNTKVLKFQISISNIQHPPCLGSFEGVAKWIDANVAEYNRNFDERDPETGEAEPCRLTFIFSGNRVIVREDDCGMYHGISCEFEGTYVRKSR